MILEFTHTPQQALTGHAGGFFKLVHGGDDKSVFVGSTAALLVRFMLAAFVTARSVLVL